MNKKISVYLKKKVQSILYSWIGISFITMVSVIFTLLIFESLLVSYAIGFFVLIQRSTKKRIKDISKWPGVSSGILTERLVKSVEGGLLAVLIAYSIGFYIIGFPLIYTIHTKTSVNLVSEATEGMIGSTLDAWNDPDPEWDCVGINYYDC